MQALRLGELRNIARSEGFEAGALGTARALIGDPTPVHGVSEMQSEFKEKYLKKEDLPDVLKAEVLEEINKSFKEGAKEVVRSNPELD